MSLDLDPIRALYGEAPSAAPGAPALDAAARAEVEALAPVRDALDRLAPTAPDAEAVAAVLAMARRATTEEPQADLGAVRALYDEGPASELSAAAHAEVEALSPVRDALARLAPVPPPAAAVAAVLSLARGEQADVGEQDGLAAIRVLYGEDAAASLSPRAEAAVHALAPVRDALAALPSVSPPADTVAAVLAMASREASGSAEATAQEGLAAVQALYGEREAAGLSGSARAEMEALAPVRDALSRLSPSTPPADTVAAVLTAARRETAPAAPARRPAADRAAARPPANPSRRRFRIGLPVLGVLAAGIALVVALGPGGGAGTVHEGVAVATDQPEVSSPPATPDAAPQAFALPAEDDALLASTTPAATAVSADPTEDPVAWDVTDDLPALALRVQALQAAGELDWEEPPVALGSGAALDATAAPAAGWMQVRMEAGR